MGPARHERPEEPALRHALPLLRASAFARGGQVVDQRPAGLRWRERWDGGAYRDVQVGRLSRSGSTSYVAGSMMSALHPSLTISAFARNDRFGSKPADDEENRAVCNAAES